MQKTGLVQIYTGNGKGKTTAAMGLAFRAAGWGKAVVVYQFLKPETIETGERKSAKTSGLAIDIIPTDIEWDMRKSLDDPDVIASAGTKIQQICEKIAAQAAKKRYDVIILDEIVFCISKKMADIELLKNIIDKKSPEVEIILTGRGATAELIELADLVTEMKLIKHPFDKGIGARKGFEF